MLSEFGKLWAASTISSLGHGVTVVAGPLLAASLTSDPVHIAGLMVAEQLPWVLLALPSGAVVDRVDCRLLLAAASAVRLIGLGTLGLAVALDAVGLPLLYLVFLLIGCAGVVYDNASTTVLPAAAGDLPLERANGRLMATRTMSDSLIGPPVGGLLFATAAWTPFVLDAFAFVVVTGLSLALSPAVGRAPAGGAARVGLRSAISEGVRWLLGHRLLRGLALTVAVSNLMLGAVLSIMVLIARDRLGLGAVGYGLLLTAPAIGGIAGGLVASRVVVLIGTGTALRVGMVVETLVYPALAVTTNAVLAGLVVAVLGLHLVLFSTINVSLRQSLAPPDMLGRVHSAYRLLSTTGMFLGAVLGGLLARQFGLTAPLWLGTLVVGTLTVCVWRILNDRVILASRSAAPSALGGTGDPADHREHD